MSKKLQVFISSTYTDLLKERQAAVASILKSGHIPAGMELFTSGDQSQWETIKQWIDESDVYMLILGGRYGSIDAASGKAYTELEFDYAVAQSKPMFSVVIDEDALERKVQAGGSAFIETKNGTALEGFRRKVLNYISSFFEDEKDIKLTVYESLAGLAAKKELVGWVRGNTAVNTLPLFEEIQKLSEENTILKSKVSELERQKRDESQPASEFSELLEVLAADKIKLPSSIASNKEPVSLLTAFIHTQKSFSSGVDNGMGMTDAENFLFFEIAPRLQIHGLVQYEKVPGVRYRRCVLTPKGAKFLSEFAKRKVKIGNELDDPSSSSDKPRNTDAPSPAPPKPAAKRAPRKQNKTAE